MRQRSGAVRRTRRGAVPTLAALVALSGAALSAPAGAEGDTGAGRVVALVGEARAVAPDGRVRSLHCFDRVQAGEVVYTTAGSRVGLLSEEVYAQLDPGANVAYGPVDGGIPELRVLDGAVRFVDTRPGGPGPQLRVETPEGRLRSLGSDMRLGVERYGARERTQVCEAASPVAIERFRPTDAIERAEAGECALVTSAGKVSKAAQKLERRVALAGADACQVDALGTVAARLTPTDVAAPPIGLTSFPARDPAPQTAREPCDDPGAGCGVVPTAPEPPPTPAPPVRQEPPTGEPGEGGLPPGVGGGS